MSVDVNGALRTSTPGPAAIATPPGLANFPHCQSLDLMLSLTSGEVSAVVQFDE